MRSLLWLPLLALTACGPNGSNGRFTLSGTVTSERQAVVLSTSQVTDSSKPDFARADFHLSVRQVISLNSTRPDGTFCSKGTGFKQLADIPTDTSGCVWQRQAAFGTLTQGARSHSATALGAGYLLRDASGTLYRMLDIDADLANGTAVVTFDVLPL